MASGLAADARGQLTRRAEMRPAIMLIKSRSRRKHKYVSVVLAGGDASSRQIPSTSGVKKRWWWPRVEGAICQNDTGGPCLVGHARLVLFLLLCVPDGRLQDQTNCPVIASRSHVRDHLTNGVFRVKKRCVLRISIKTDEIRRER